MSVMPAPAMLRFGLRFPKSQARTLRNIADRVASLPPGIVDVGLYEKAAQAARDGEPLVVLCSEPAEAQLMAQGFVDIGVARPTIDDMNAGGWG